MAGKVGKFWREHRPILERLARQGLTDKQIHESGEIPGKSVSSITNARQRFNIPGGEHFREQHHGIPELTAKVTETEQYGVYRATDAEEEPVADIWDRALRRTDRAKAKAETEGLARIRLMTDQPIAISLSADWHVTTEGACDLRGLRDYAEATRDTEGAYALAVGDLYDNPIKWTKNLREVPDSVRLVDDLFGTFGLKLLGTTDGNHDAWARAAAGLDAIRWVANKNRVLYAPDELVYIVDLVSPNDPDHRTARYVIATRHKFRRNSNLNWTHACWRFLEERVGQWPLDPEGDGTLIPDIVAIADNHLAAVETREYDNGPKWAARMGPWQVTSDYARKKGFFRCPPTAPTFLLHPHRRKRIVGYSSYLEAYEHLAQERAA